MRSRHLRKKRLVILLGVLLSLLALGAGTYSFSVRRQRAMLAKLRVDAMAAYNAGEFDTAAQLFGQYLTSRAVQDKDPESLFAYGKSRVNAPMPRMQHVYDGIAIFERYLSSKEIDESQRLAARRELLQLYPRAGYLPESITLADRFLALNARDSEAHHVKISALEDRHEIPAALNASRALNRVAPQDIWGQEQTLSLLHLKGTREQEALDQLSALRLQYPADARFEMLTAYAYGLWKDSDAQNKWLLTAADHPATGPELVSALSDQLDRNGFFEAADKLIRRSAQGTADPLLKRCVAQRLWRDGDSAGVIAITDGSSDSSAKGDPILLAYRSLALWDSGKHPQARAIAAALASRRKDKTAAVWAEVVHARFDPPAPAQLPAVIEHALAIDGDIAELHQMLADAQSALGETELAIAECHQAFLAAPGWAAPHVAATNIFTRTHRYDYALDTSIDALNRAPNAQETQVAHALALERFLSTRGRTADYSAVLDHLRALRTRWQDARTLPAEVDLLALMNQTGEAAQLMESVLVEQPVPSSAVLLDLADVYAWNNLPYRLRLVERAREAYGAKPEITLAQAMSLHAAGHDADAESLLARKAASSADAMEWELARAKLIEAVSPSRALTDWQRLAKQYPAEPRVLQAILKSSSRSHDRTFWAATIDRQKALTGEQGLLWRVERSRWLLADSTNPLATDNAVVLLTQVIAQAPNYPEAHQLLAEAFENRNDLSSASGEMRTYSRLRPDDINGVRHLVELLVLDHHPVEATKVLEELTARGQGSGETGIWITRQYALLDQQAAASAAAAAAAQTEAQDVRRRTAANTTLVDKTKKSAASKATKSVVPDAAILPPAAH